MASLFSSSNNNILVIRNYSIYWPRATLASMISHACCGINRTIRESELRDERRCSNGCVVGTVPHEISDRSDSWAAAALMMAGNKLGNGPFIG